MAPDMPRVVQRPTPNYSPTPIKHDLLIAHMMEGGYAGSVAWLCERAAQASAHLCMSEDGGEVSQLVPLQFKAWAQCAFNSRGVSLEIPGRTAAGIPEARWRAAALIFGWLCVAYDIAPVWAKDGQGRGLCQHHDLGAAGGGHVDCSTIGSPTWLTFVGMVQAARDEFARAPGLPPCLLHGLPNPHQVELPPDVAPTPSHGGAPRSGVGDAITHPTASGFPHGSVADLQWRLDSTGVSPGLSVDGFAGPLTRNALAAFQSKHGLYVDGLIGPKTWAALDAATAA
ncbi:MAG TPA: peptidoglycan-binding protein [Roseiarcus sp.]|nr:peptidoglycan-binding protein [Roseiarcus sp.]